MLLASCGGGFLNDSQHNLSASVAGLVELLGAARLSERQQRFHDRP
jgi:hypothetical protein